MPSGEPTTEQERIELMDTLVAAANRHIRHINPIVPGFSAFVIDTDVELRILHKVLKEGIYQVRTPEDGTAAEDVPPECYWVWGMELDMDSPDVEPGKLKMKLVRIDVSEGVPLSIFEVWLWLAVQDALNAGDVDGAQRLVDTSYRPVALVEDENTARIQSALWNDEADEETQEPPILEAIAPKKHIVPNSKPTQVLRHGKSPMLFEDGGQLLFVDSKKTTQIQFALWQDEEASIEVSEEIDAEDVAVIEAVTTLKHAGNTVITPGQIIRNMGYKQSTSALVEEIHQRVLRLMSIKGRIDWTQQAHKLHKVNPDTGEPYDHAEIIGNLLSMTVFDGTDVKGNRDIRYKVASDPITYEHARLVNQVVVYPPELVELAPINEDGAELKRVNRDQKKLVRAVLWYVFSLKSQKNRMNNYVTYEALFDYEGYEPGSDSARKRAVKFVQAYLRALQCAGVIYAFTPEIERSRRRKQLGVTIHVEKP